MMRIGTPLSPSATRVMLLGSGELGKEVIIALQRFGEVTHRLHPSKFGRVAGAVTSGMRPSRDRTASPATLSVPTLSARAKVKVPPGTQPGEVLRLRGAGLPCFRESGQGDINIRIEVKVPERLSAQERALYEQLAALARDARKD